MKYKKKELTETESAIIYDQRYRTDNKTIAGIRIFCMSRLFMWLTVACGAVFMICGQQVMAALFYMMMISALLVICDDVLTTTMPFMALCISVLQCYDSFDIFIKYVWLAPVPVAALIFHFIFYRRKIVFGSSFKWLIAVSIAVTLGGLGAISIKDYFSPTSIFYVVMLGFGMCIAYLLIKSQIVHRRDYDIREKFIDIMIIVGCFACFESVVLVIESIVWQNFTFQQFVDYFLYFEQRFCSNEIDLILQPSNNLSTFIMLSLPFVFYKVIRNSRLYALLIVFMLVCIFLTKSRGGLLLGLIEFMICFVLYAFMIKNKVFKFIIFAMGLIMILLVGILGFIFIMESDINLENETRYGLILRSIQDFKNNPLFGQGIGSQNNADLYPGKTGTMIWYHMIIPQIVGSMGILGILAYVWQFFGRLRLSLKKLNPYTFTFAMSYVGLLLMSQVNPGEFSPLPYGLIAVILFIMIENEPDRKVDLKNSLLLYDPKSSSGKV